MKSKKAKQNNSLMEIFGFNVNFYRKAAGLSQLELAQSSGYAHNFINDIENSKKGASFETVYCLC